MSRLGYADYFYMGNINSGDGAAFDLTLSSSKTSPSNFNAIYIILFTPGNTEIAVGTYNIKTSGLEMPFYFDNGSIRIVNNAMNIDDPITDGTIEIQKTNGEYDIQFNFELESGKDVSGNYSGELILTSK